VPPVTTARGAGRLAGADADDLGQIAHEDLAVADLAGAGGGHDLVDDGRRLLVADNDLDLHLGEEVDGILGTAVGLGVPLLASETADLGDGHAADAGGIERVLHLFELEVADDGFDLFHGTDS
jgi:hypothetical protein